MTHDQAGKIYNQAIADAFEEFRRAGFSADAERLYQQTTATARTEYTRATGRTLPTWR